MIDAVLAQPGYLVHTAIALGYMLRYRATLDAPRYRYALGRVRAMVGPSACDARDLEAPRGAEPPSERTLEGAVGAFLASGPREVHTPTLADAACDLWDGVESRRAAIEALLLRFSRLELQREATGERRSS